MLRDPKHLWSPYGLRSLSVSHPEFGQGEDYWKGPIWIQMNYLTLGSLYKTYAAQKGPYQQKAKDIYAELRKNIIDNVAKVSFEDALSTMMLNGAMVQEYERTGYVWEQYNALTGEGKRRQVHSCGMLGLVLIFPTLQPSIHRLDIVGITK